MAPMIVRAIATPTMYHFHRNLGPMGMGAVPAVSADLAASNADGDSLFIGMPYLR